MTAMTAPFLTDYDLYLLGEGDHYRLYEKLGARRPLNGSIATTLRKARSVLAQGKDSGGPVAGSLQLYPGAATQLPHRRPARRTLGRASQFRRIALRRQWSGQTGRSHGRARRLARPLAPAERDASAPGDRDLQSSTDRRDQGTRLRKLSCHAALLAPPAR